MRELAGGDDTVITCKDTGKGKGKGKRSIIVDNKCDNNGHFKLCCETSAGSNKCK